ncbi:MAG: DUF4159 domain-containing protein [Candidatus Hydrogenedentes bacterium]|nr:DUF4159 domain-containing protein [Candidatus Hydrogenedentota bacterium]
MLRRRLHIAIFCCVALCLVFAHPAAQADTGPPPPQVPEGGRDAFTFVRVQYDSMGGWGEARYNYDGRIWERWETDFPEAEENLIFRLRQLTTLRLADRPISLRLNDKRLFQYPFLYMADPGWQDLKKDEQDGLREYLTRGGFLWVDDFWGDAEWDNFAFNMAQIFPDLPWTSIPDEHPVLSMVFPLKTCPQVPAHIFAFQYPGQDWDSPYGHRGEPPEQELMTVHFKGLFLEGRLIALATHNTDIGDGWEREANDRRYFETYSIKAYALAVNIIVYALTH